MRPTSRLDLATRAWWRAVGDYIFSGCYSTRRLPGADRDSIHVYVDEHDVLRTDHDLRLWGAPVVRLHYRLSAQDQVK